MSARERLTALLIELWKEDAGEPLDGIDGVSEAIDAYLARLLPVVDRIANQRAAVELETRADVFDALQEAPAIGRLLRARAAALRASNGQGAT